MGDQMFISIPSASARARLGGTRRSPRGSGVSPFHGSCVGGTLLPPTECFPSAEGLCGHSQASFPSKLERAMAKACRAHSGYR